MGERRRGAVSWALVAATALACGSGDRGPAAPAEPTLAEGPHPVASIRVKDLGEIRIELLPEIAPGTVANFRKLAREGFYDGTTFHRVIPGFMIQGGDPNSRNRDPRDDGKGGPGYTIPAEPNALSHRRGVVSMARGASPHSAGSQFFIVHADSPDLDGAYTAFGRVLEGMDVVDAITRLEIDTYGRFGPRDRPHPVDAVVESVRVEPPA